MDSSLLMVIQSYFGIFLLLLLTWTDAEIYICKSERQFSLKKDPSDSWTSTSSNDAVDIVIDTAQGLKLDRIESEDYVGACRYSSYGGYFCTWEADGRHSLSSSS